jgi:Leucine-rich repeat (LRR) protein
MEPEIDLPPVPILQADSPPELPIHPNKRKRARLEYDPISSSDPALFSSDDHNPTSEHYASKRRKQKWRGTWWGDKITSSDLSASNGGKRTFTRNFDSGVWMGSDATDTSLEIDFLEDSGSGGRQTSTFTIPLGSRERGGNTIGDDGTISIGDVPTISEDVNETKIHPSSTRTPASGEERTPPFCAAVDQIIDRCLEAGDENVDLSTMGLDDVPNVSLRRLRSLTKHSTIQDLPPSQDSYVPIEPALRLYLSNNSIPSFPSEILNLSNLRVLSLRHNKLTKVPPSLARLPNLEHLNLAGNKLRHLPYEMLRLYDRGGFQMIATPNPLEQLQSDQAVPEREFNLSSFLEPSLVARSSASYFRIDGLRVGDTMPRLLTRAPSLVELALQKCSKLPDLAEIKDWCAVGEGPATLSTLLAMAQEVNEYGDLECTGCGKSFIVPRAEWTEWWRLPFRRTDVQQTWTSPLPAVAFVRQACSWACVEELQS